MKMKKLLLVIAASLTMTLGTVALLIACMGSPTPPGCPQSIFLAKFTPSTVVIPPGGASFTVGIGVLPFVSWDNVTPGCAQPASADVMFTLTCTPSGGGTPFTLGPATSALATPTAPGPQPVPGGSIPFTIPAGTPPSTCTVTGTYGVAFSGGIGAGLLQGTGDTQICLVEPSPQDVTVPRLDLELIVPETPPGTPGLYSFHAGDQTYVFVKASNNDLERTATFDFFSEGRQAAGFPDGFTDEEDAYTAGVFRISNTDGDVFPSQLFDQDAPLPFDRVPGDPLDPGPQRLEGLFTLEPGELAVFGVAVNSFGACADGSCSERNICAEVTLEKEGEAPEFADACVQFAYLVNNALPPRYPGLTIRDEIKVDPLVDVQWTGIEFLNANGALIDQTHRANLLPGQRIEATSGIQTMGQGLQPPLGRPPFPDTWVDEITLPGQALSARWRSFFFYEQDGFNRRDNEVVLHGLEHLEDDCAFPAITLNNPKNPANNFVQVEADVSGGCGENMPIQLFENGQLVRQGTLEQLREDPNLRIDGASCRTLRFPHGNLLDALFLVSDPPFLVNNFPADETEPLVQTVTILDQFGNPADWQNAQIEGPDGAAPVTPAGNGELEIVFDPGVFTDPLDTREWFLSVENPAAVNSPLVIPLPARRQFPSALLPLDFEFDAPPLAQVGSQYDAGIFIPPIDPQPVDPYFNMEFFIGIETNDPIEIEIPEPFLIVPIDPDTPAPELERLKGKFGEDPINRCSEGVWKCGRIEFGDGFTFESEIFADGFESGDVSSWSTGAAADNSQRREKQQSVGVLGEDRKLPVFSPEELREAIMLFNDDTGFDEKTIGLVSERFGIVVPLPPVRGTYFFDEFESFRKDDPDPPVTLDGSGCPAPCDGLVLQGNSSGVNGIRFENFPGYGLVLEADTVTVTGSVFAGNGAGGLRIDGSGNVIGGAAETGNRFEGNGGPGLVVASGDGNAILYNTFAANDGPGIDLGGDGATPNDDGDGDTGPNLLQNFPVLTQVLSDAAGGTLVAGTLDGIAGRTYTLQFFASDACDPSGNGEGDALLGTASVADAGVPFSLTIEGGARIGQFVTATATEDEHGRTSEFSACFQVVSGVAREDEEPLPTTFVLFQNYPNPFNPTTTIRYAVPQAGRIRLAVFDMLGRLVAVLVDEERPAGEHVVAFEARDLPSGTYLYRLTGAGFTQTRKFVLFR